MNFLAADAEINGVDVLHDDHVIDRYRRYEREVSEFVEQVADTGRINWDDVAFHFSEGVTAVECAARECQRQAIADRDFGISRRAA